MQPGRANAECRSIAEDVVNRGPQSGNGRHCLAARATGRGPNLPVEHRSAHTTHHEGEHVVDQIPHARRRYRKEANRPSPLVGARRSSGGEEHELPSRTGTIIFRSPAKLLEPNSCTRVDTRPVYRSR